VKYLWKLYVKIYYNINMTLGNKSEREPSDYVVVSPSIIKDDSYTFNDVVNKACEGLMTRQIKYTIRRIEEMEKNLSDLENELDEFLAGELSEADSG